MRHCQSLQEGMGNSEVCNLWKRKDELTRENFIRVTFKINQKKKGLFAQVR